MLSFSDCHGIIDEQIKLLDIRRKKPTELYAPISYILSLGGKRIRPVMTLMACNLFTGDVRPAVNPALAIEVFHNFTLVHDDIMDNASLRRGKPTVHAKWNNNIAILSGDAMQVYVYQLLVGDNPAFLKTLLDVFNATALEVCEGQQYDMNFAKLTNVTLDEYLQMIELKTSVLLAASLKIGAICGGATDEDAQKLYEFGRNLGLAFQIQDDYLDVYGDQDLFGKTVGGDIAENKKTFLLIKALELAKGKAADDLQRAISNQISNSFEKVEVVRGIYDDLNIPQITCDKIAEFSDKAFEYLSAVTIGDSRKSLLSELARGLMVREK
jgi:geranylgeranyl diphosphate synthase, type II